VLDPFCGCGTTIAAAQQLDRRWIGIDITHLSIALQKYRLRDTFGLAQGVDYQVVGEPEDLAGARQLAEDDRFQFQAWALSLVEAQPVGRPSEQPGARRGKDRGMDGVIRFIEAQGRHERVIVQVKSGKVSVRDVRDLLGTIERERAAMGVLITLEEPTRDMLTDAADAGRYRSEFWGRDYPRIQVLTIEQLFGGKRVDMPTPYGTFKQAPRVNNNPGAEQNKLF
jgi:site-specific DNA-methyltransferase (adenine-specific)